MNETATKTCANPRCHRLVPEKKKLYCSHACKRSVQNARYLNKLRAYKERALNGTEEMNDTTPMAAHEENNHRESDFMMQLLQPGSLPSPTKDPVVSYFIYDYKEKLQSAIREIDKRDDKIDRLSEKLKDQEREIYALNRSIERLEDEQDKANDKDKGFSGVMEGFKDGSGQINWQGVAQTIEGLGKGAAAIMGRNSTVPAGLEGVNSEIAPNVQAFSQWFGQQTKDIRQKVWQIIQAISNKPDLIIPILNTINNG